MLRFLLLTGLDLLGIWYAVAFIRTPDEVTLFWPPAGIAFDQAIRSLRPSGTCSFIGVPGRDGDRLPISIGKVINGELSLRGSNVGSRLDLAEAIRFAVEGQVKVKVERQPLRAINKVLERMRRGKIVGRVVLDIAAGG